MKKRPTTVSICVLILAAVAAGAAWRFMGPGGWPWEQGSASERRAAPAARAPVPAGMKRYSHPAFRFSLIVPEAAKIGSYRQPGQVARTITFTMPEGDGRQFQIYVVPYEKEQIGSSQIAKDTHGRATGTPEDVVIGGGIRALLFTTEDPALGSLREIWFLHDGRLYEATVRAADEAWLSEILQSWEFLNS